MSHLCTYYSSYPQKILNNYRWNVELSTCLAEVWGACCMASPGCELVRIWTRRGVRCLLWPRRGIYTFSKRQYPSGTEISHMWLSAGYMQYFLLLTPRHFKFPGYFQMLFSYAPWRGKKTLLFNTFSALSGHFTTIFFYIPRKPKKGL